MNDMAKNLILWLIIAAVLVTVMNNFSSPPESHKLNYSEFIQQVQEGKVKEVTVDGYLISAKSIDGNTFDIVRPAIADNGLIKDLMDNNVAIVGKQPENAFRNFFKYANPGQENFRSEFVIIVE